jgi:hypothetical protein
MTRAEEDEDGIGDPFDGEGLNEDTRSALTRATRVRDALEGIPPYEQLRVLMFEATHVARGVDKELATVLAALNRALLLGEVGDLVQRKGTMASVAYGYAHGHDERGKRKAVLTDLASCFVGKTPTDDYLRQAAPSLADLMAEWIPDAPSHVDAIVKQCIAARDRMGRPGGVMPGDYVRAILRGCGLSAADAKDWTKGIE